MVSLTIGLLFACVLPITGAEAAEVPKTVKALWSNFNPRKDALDAKTVREWQDGGITYRYVIFHVGTFKGRESRMAAFYAFPSGATKLPGLLHLHGDGQRAFRREVEYYA